MCCGFLLFFLFFRSGVETLPHNAKAHYNYANFLKDVGRDEEAILHYETALKWVYLLINVWFQCLISDLCIFLNRPLQDNNMQDQFLRTTRASFSYFHLDFNALIAYFAWRRLTDLDNCETVWRCVASANRAQTERILGKCAGLEVGKVY